MLRLLSDEDLDGRVIDGLRQTYPEIDLVRALDVGLSGQDGVDDQAILAWAADHDRILLTSDRRTMAGFGWIRVSQGLHFPGIFALRPGISIKAAIEAVALVALCQ